MSLFVFVLKKMRSKRLGKFEEKVNFPLVNPADYFNRKYSVVTQAVLDSRMMFMDVSTGFRAAYSKTLQ